MCLRFTDDKADGSNLEEVSWDGDHARRLADHRVHEGPPTLCARGKIQRSSDYINVTVLLQTG
jgi:hypothetical protein